MGGNEKFFGPGSNFQVDSTQPITVTTQFITAGGSDHGKLTEVKQFYTQNGKTIEHPAYTVNGNQHKTITDEYCKDWVAETQDGTNFLDKGGLKAMGEAMDAGVVLVMSLWDDHYANMLWLDSTYPVDSTDPGADRGSCPTTSGVPKDVESKQADAKVTFSDIKFGPIGSTGGSPTPSPPAPPSGGCCSWDGEYCGDTTDYCKASASQCADCNGKWCTDCKPPFVPTPKPSPAPTPVPTPSPSPSPSGCPGGSLDACIDLCP